MAASAAVSAPSKRPLGQASHGFDTFGVLGEEPLDGLVVGRPVHVREVEHLVVDAPVSGAVADDPEHRPRDAPFFAQRGDCRRLHVERHHAAGP